MPGKSREHQRKQLFFINYLRHPSKPGQIWHGLRNRKSIRIHRPTPGSQPGGPAGTVFRPGCCWPYFVANPDTGGISRRFSIAHWVEQLTKNQPVAGSNPARKATPHGADAVPGITAGRGVWAGRSTGPATLPHRIAQAGLAGQQAAHPGAPWPPRHGSPGLSPLLLRPLGPAIRCPPAPLEFVEKFVKRNRWSGGPKAPRPR